MFDSGSVTANGSVKQLDLEWWFDLEFAMLLEFQFGTVTHCEIGWVIAME